MNGEIQKYCQVLKIKASDGTVKQLYFPKALDLFRPKRPRTTFSEEQLRALERRFAKSPYLVGNDRKRLAEELQLSETQIKVWYQNRRTKRKISSIAHEFDDERQAKCEEQKLLAQPLPLDTMRNIHSATVCQNFAGSSSIVNSSPLFKTEIEAENLWSNFSKILCSRPSCNPLL